MVPIKADQILDQNPVLSSGSETDHPDIWSVPDYKSVGEHTCRHEQYSESSLNSSCAPFKYLCIPLWAEFKSLPFSCQVFPFEREWLSSALCQFGQVGMLRPHRSCLGHLMVSLPWVLFVQTSWTLLSSWSSFLCSSPDIPMIFKVTIKTFSFDFSVLCRVSFPSRSSSLPLVVYNKEHQLSLYSYETKYCICFN